MSNRIVKHFLLLTALLCMLGPLHATAIGFPVPLVEIDGVAIADVLAVKGPLAETQVILFREGSDGILRKLPGPGGYGEVVIKRRVVTDDVLWTWHQQIASGNLTRKTVVVTFKEPKSGAFVRYTMTNAWPSKVALDDADARERGFSTEDVTIVFENVQRAGPVGVIDVISGQTAQ